MSANGSKCVLRIFLVALAAYVEIGTAVNAENGQKLAGCELHQVFADEFDTLKVASRVSDGSGWTAHTPWNGDFGDAAFVDPTPDFPFTVRDGILTIEARKNETGKWNSGLLASADSKTTGFSQKYGYFEIRAKLPPGPGTWPAFWLSTNKPGESTETSVEIDVIEHYGHFPTEFRSTIHVWNKPPNNGHIEKSHVTKVPRDFLYADFHLYGVDVGPELITFYLDHQEIWRAPTPPEHVRPLLILIDLGLGSGWAIDKVPNPSRMLVDYVRVYERRCPAAR